MTYVTQYASLELKNKVLDLLRDKNLEINKEVRQGGEITRILIQILKNTGPIPLEALMDIHEEVFLKEALKNEGDSLNIENIRSILFAFWGIRKEMEIEAHLKGFLASVGVSKMRLEDREKIKNIITNEYMEQ